jgi:ABC-type transport system substrate-binding protein
VGELQPLNPWFTVENDVNRDIVSLVFAGLMRYNPQSKHIEHDLATMEVSKDSKVYTMRLKDNVYWHDSTEEEPHPVTADDVVFTFQTVQDPDFPNLLLQQNFRGVLVEKIDVRTARFTLDEPYSFFSSNLTLGLLPKRAFEGIPIGKLDEALDFGFSPIGAGPYRMKTIVQTDLSSEVTLERFQRTLEPIYRLDRIVFRIFPDYSSLLSDLRNLQGVRLVARNDRGEAIIPKRFTARNYYLPQYVALFFNLDTPMLQEQNLRVGLQLGTDKQELVDTIHESVIVDTPLLEIDVSDWHYQFDSDSAQGSLLASKWNLPERFRLQRVLEMQEANKSGQIHPPMVIVAEQGKALTLSGSYADVPPGSTLNGVALVTQETNTGSWIVRIPLGAGTGAIVAGENLLRLINPEGKIVDSAYVIAMTDERGKRRADEEQRLAALFTQSKNPVPDRARIAIGNLTVADGMLRLRTSDDPVSVRRNEKGEELKLTLLTSPAPPSYKTIAETIKKQWGVLGVDVTITIPQTRQEFEEMLLKREYDLLLFGQSLLDNLDSHPYWHSSGAQKVTGQEKDLRRDAYNLSQYTSFKADALLETIRKTNDEQERKQALVQLRTVLENDVPAIFLYSPVYTLAQHQNILGVELGSLSLHSDRFLTLHKWYVKEERVFQPGKGWFSIFSWLPSLL